MAGAAGAAFKDTWTLSDLGVAADEHPGIANLLHTARLTHGKGMQSYLTMMAVRLRDEARPQGDRFHLHCFEALMDAVFGSGNFRNEVVWKRTAGRSDAKQFGRVMCCCSMRTRIHFQEPSVYAHDPDYVARAYRNEDAGGQRSSRGIWPLARTPAQHCTNTAMNDFIIDKGLIPG